MFSTVTGSSPVPLIEGMSVDTLMMTSSNRNFFRVTGHLCGEFTGPRWNFPHKGQWRGALIFSLICVWINGWVNNREAGDLRRCRAHYNVTVMWYSWIRSCSRCFLGIELLIHALRRPVSLVLMLSFPLPNTIQLMRFRLAYIYHVYFLNTWAILTRIARFMGPIWGPPGSCPPQVGSMLTPWTLLSG